MGAEYVNLALLTDGLRAEREQGITIDVAYRYFATPKRKFIIADTPGHIQYTRNMVTGASTADLALILVDARNGIVEQSRRHTFLASLLRIPHIVVCVNKMDLVDWSEERFDEIKDEFQRVRHEARDRRPVVRAGVRAAGRQRRRPFGQHALVRRLLAAAPPRGGAHRVGPQPDRPALPGAVRHPAVLERVPRLPRLRRHPGRRGHAPGDEVIVLPSGFTSTIKTIDTADGRLEEAYAPMSVTVTLNDEIDISRGDMICRPHNQPTIAQDIDAMVCWMTEQSKLAPRMKLGIKHTTRSARCMIKDVHYRLDVNTLHRDEHAENLQLNEMGRVSLRTTLPLFFDEYRRNRETGSFILIDEGTNATVGAGMIMGPSQRRDQRECRHEHHVARRRGRSRGPSLPRCHRLADRALGLGQVDRGGRARAAAGVPGSARLPAGRRQRAPRPERRPRVQRGRPHRERAAGGRGGPTDGRRGRRRDRAAHQPVPRRP